MKKVFAAALLLAVISGFAFAGGGKADSAPKADSSQLKIAMLMPGPINDGGWNTMAYNALMEAKKSLGADVAFTENVKQNDQVQLLRQYASRGYGVIIGHGFEFGDSLSQVGEEFPNTYFVNYGGAAKNGKNVGSINYAYGETGALMGVLIGMQPGITKVGGIHAFEQPTTQQESFNVERYAKKYNPNIQFVYSYTGDYDDIAKGKEAAIALLNNGCQIIVSDMSGPAGAITQAVKDKNAKYVEIGFEASDLCPDNIICSAVQDATMATLAAIKEIQAGRFVGKVYNFGLKDGVMSVGKYGPSVTAAMKTELEKVKAEIEAGKGDLLILIKD
ncbi:BMP family ABC transporter substrate-binding protein [Spirochaetia bacterium]|nr:BMP family ABC transporter substrate-binding protein [Spirochaetia bacterium]